MQTNRFGNNYVDIYIRITYILQLYINNTLINENQEMYPT